MTVLIKDILSSDYTLGDFVEYLPILHGDVNKSYTVTVKVNGKKRIYYLKQYHPQKKENEIIFEHEIITHLEKKQFNLVAGLIRAKNRKTYTKRFNGQDHYFALFHLLSGEDRYGWFLPRCSRKDLGNAAAVLARFHNVVADFKTAGKCYDFKIIDFLSAVPQSIPGYPKKGIETPFELYLHKNVETILAFVKGTIRTLKENIKTEDSQRLPHRIIHGDYHPGNLKFTNDRVTGLFDFDWAKRGLRCFDVALAITYFCMEGGKNDTERLCMEKTRDFLLGYQDACDPATASLNENELKLMPVMIKAAAVYILDWVIQSYCAENNRINHDLYLTYLTHYTEFMQWLEKKGDHHIQDQAIG